MTRHHLPGTEAIDDLGRLYPDLFIVEITLHRVTSTIYALWGLAATASPGAKILRTIGGTAHWNPEGWAYDLSTSPVDALPGRELLALRDAYFARLDTEAADAQEGQTPPDDDPEALRAAAALHVEQQAIYARDDRAGLYHHLLRDHDREPELGWTLDTLLRDHLDAHGLLDPWDRYPFEKCGQTFHANPEHLATVGNPYVARGHTYTASTIAIADATCQTGSSL